MNRLTLKGFKSVREMDLSLGAVNVLIGANGVGKSNFLSFLRLLNAVGEGNLQMFVGKQGGANALLHHGRKHTPQLEATMHFDVKSGKSTYAMSLVGVSPDDLMFADEVVTFESAKGKAKPPTTLGRSHRESRLPEAVDSDTTARTVKWTLDRWRVYHFHDTSAEASIKQK